LEDGAFGRVARAVVGWIGGVVATQVEALALVIAGSGLGSEVELAVFPAVDVDGAMIGDAAYRKRQTISVALCV
jgi:indole-3-glycerol phosphate synthase